MPLGRRRPDSSRAAKALNRRMFMKAMALGMSVPAAARLARMATAAVGSAPKRFFLMYIPHGTAPEHFNPKIANADPLATANYPTFDLDQTNVSILGPLQPYKQYVNVYQGFQYPGDAATHTGIVNCLSGSTAIDQAAARTSVEHVIAKALNVKPLILGACSHITNGLDANGMLFWNGTPVDPEKNPVKAFDTLFGGGTTTPPVNADVQLQKDLLAFTASEIQGLSATLAGLTSEQTKLQTHLEAIQSLQADGNTVTPPSSCSTKPNLPSVEMVRTKSAGNVVQPGGGNDYFYKEENFPLLFAAQLELITQAIICNAAPIIGLMPMYATCDFDFGFAGAPGAHHNGLSHTMYQANTTAPYGAYNSPLSIANLQTGIRTPFATAQKWFYTQLVNKVVSVLATTDDPAAPGSKVLDNTLIYVMSEIGDGQDHTRVSEILYPQTPDYLPLVTIGKCGGAITSGQVVQFPIKEKGTAATVNRPAADLYLTIARAMGAANVTFPGQTGVLPGVLAS
jgi:hypothetical protein